MVLFELELHLDGREDVEPLYKGALLGLPHVTDGGDVQSYGS